MQKVGAQPLEAGLHRDEVGAESHGLLARQGRSRDP
jgi:hypothetical protein